jgi:hypothetical protein
MQAGPRILWENRYTRLKLAQLLGQLGVFLTWAICACKPSIFCSISISPLCRFEAADEGVSAAWSSWSTMPCLTALSTQVGPT